MFDWIKNNNKEYPEFWKNYLSKFDSKSNKFNVISLDCTGDNSLNDVIVAIGSIAVVNNSIIINDSFEILLLQYIYLHNNGLSNEFITKSKKPKLGELEAIEKFIDYIGNSVLVGYRINNSVGMINAVLEKMACGRLKNEALDLEIMHQKLIDAGDKHFSMEEILQAYGVPDYELSTSSENAYSLALLFLKLKSKLGIQ